MTNIEPTDLPAQRVDEIPPVRWLAGLAMQGLVIKHGVPDSDETRDEFALWSYRMAQSMLNVESQLHLLDKQKKK